MSAAGAVIPNEAEKHVEVETDEGQMNKALFSVNNETGRVLNFKRADGVSRLRLRVAEEHASGLQRLGMQVKTYQRQLLLTL